MIKIYLDVICYNSSLNYVVEDYLMTWNIKLY